MSETAAAAEEKIVTMDNVSFESDGYGILRDVNLSIYSGKSTVIMGHAGSGKSTLLKVAAGLLLPSSGKVILEGKDLSRMTGRENLRFRKDHGFVFQDAALWANMTIYQNLSLPLEVHHKLYSKTEIDEKIRKSVERFSFEKELHVRPAQLSTGEQKIVAFMRALITGPRVLFLDEPTSSIDHESMEIILSIIKEFRQAGNTVIAVTHDSNLASLFAEHLILVKNGEILSEGPFNTVIRTADTEAASILAEVMKQPSSFDTDILELLSPEEDNRDEP